jgi:excisionase family DNA binding protein
MKPVEAAVLMGVSRQRVHQLMKKGRLGYKVVPGGVLYRRVDITVDDIERWRTGGRGDLPAPAGFMSVEEVAYIFGVSGTAVYRWVGDGLMAAERRGGRIWCRSSDVQSFTPPKRGRPRKVA